MQKIVGIGLLIFVIAIFGYAAFNPVKTIQSSDKAIVPTPSPSPSMPQSTTLFQLVNDERVKIGLTPLIASPELDQSATAKCSDMVAKNYWAHNAPDGTEPWTFILAQLPEYKTAGENLAHGYITAEQVVASWMQSPSHKGNIVDPVYSQVGYAVCSSNNFMQKGPANLVVQHFVSL